MFYKKSHNNLEMIESIIQNGVLNTPGIIEALKIFDRKKFCIPSQKEVAYEDKPLDIGHKQTISQPFTLVFMLELLDVQKGDKVLDIGSGSCWSSAILSHLTGKTGSVDALEIIPALVELGQKNLDKNSVANVKNMHTTPEILGIPGNKYDRILVSASANKLPLELLKQLKSNGVLVIPVQDSILKVTLDIDAEYSIETYDGFKFVPLVN